NRFEGFVSIPIRIKKRTSGQRSPIGGRKRRDLRMRAIPPEIVIAEVELELRCHARRDRTRPVARNSCGVLVKRRTERGVWTPAEIGLFEAIDDDTRHETVTA